MGALLPTALLAPAQAAKFLAPIIFTADLKAVAVADPDIESVSQTPELFRDALALYQHRPDKSWSLTDCASFLIMDRQQIAEALTHDRHFEQRGYRALLRD